MGPHQLNIPLALPNCGRHLTPANAWVRIPTFWIQHRAFCGVTLTNLRPMIWLSVVSRQNSLPCFEMPWNWTRFVAPWKFCCRRISQLIKCQNTFSATAYRGHGQTKRQDKKQKTGEISILSTTGGGRLGYQGHLYKDDWFMWQFSTAFMRTCHAYGWDQVWFLGKKEKLKLVWDLDFVRFGSRSKRDFTEICILIFPHLRLQPSFNYSPINWFAEQKINVEKIQHLPTAHELRFPGETKRRNCCQK